MKAISQWGGSCLRLRSSGKRKRLALILCLALFVSILTPAGACKRSTEQALKSAAEAWDSGDYELAAEEYEHYLERNPTGEQSLEARFHLANIYYLNLNRHDQARAHYKEFLSQDPSHPNAYTARERLAEVLAELGRWYEAIAEYENLNPKDLNERRRIRLAIADLYTDQKNYSQALTEYAKVIETAPYDQLSELAYQREASIYHIARSQYQLALPVYQKLAAQSDDPKVRLRALYAMADCYAGLYQFDEAIKTLREIKDEGEQGYTDERVAELERQKREAVEARSGIERKP